MALPEGSSTPEQPELGRDPTPPIHDHGCAARGIAVESDTQPDRRDDSDSAVEPLSAPQSDAGTEADTADAPLQPISDPKPQRAQTPSTPVHGNAASGLGGAPGLASPPSDGESDHGIGGEDEHHAADPGTSQDESTEFEPDDEGSAQGEPEGVQCRVPDHSGDASYEPSLFESDTSSDWSGRSDVDPDDDGRDLS